MKIFKVALTLCLFTTFSGCAVFKNDKKEAETREEATASAEKLFNKGLKHNRSKNYSLAIENFGKLEARYPFGDYAQQAQLEMAYAYYKQKESDAALAALDQFLKLNPRHQHIDYAYYLKGLIHFNVSSSFIGKFMDRNEASMDVLPLQQSFNYFRQLVELYPESRYVDDSRQRMLHLRNLLASHELKVAKFYKDRGAYTAVAERAAYVIEHYQGADTLPEALTLLAEAYDKLGLAEAHKETLQILEYNYPEHKK